MADNKPRISINKLAEYCEATPSRRKRIVENAKDPKVYIVTWYSEAKKAIKDFLIQDDNRVITEAIDHINQLPVESGFQAHNYVLSIEALEKLMDCDISPLSDYSIQEFAGENTMLEIAGVDISVNPDIILTKEDHIGALKIHIKKDGLSEESMNIISVVLHQFVENIIAVKGQTADFKMCFAFDVFSGQLVSAPKSFKRRMRSVEDACEEIALWWDKL
jgi:hypothetical protein